MSRGLGAWLRTLGSGGIAALGLAVLWSSWPEGGDRGEALPSDPWTVTARAGWRPEPPQIPAEDDSWARGSEASDESAPPSPLPGAPEGFVLYTVVKKDSLWRIAERELGSPRRIPEIERANAGILERPLIPGTQILLPRSGVDGGARSLAAAPGPVAPAPKVRRHAVGKGETLSRIGERYGVSADAIFAANRDQLRSKDKVRAGQRLRIPPAEGGVR